jgi:F-type H+-transporting ATPase subunit delta
VALGREALLLSAKEQGQLGTVEDELFRLGRIVAGDAAFEQALSDRTATAESKRALLGQVLYGKVTAVTEALASQAVARPEGMPADDIDALSRMAAEIEGQSVAVVTAASDLSQEQQETLSRKLAGIYGREMTVHVEVDPAVLGGMVIRVGDEVIDGSVAGRLSAVRRALP